MPSETLTNHDDAMWMDEARNAEAERDIELIRVNCRTIENCATIIQTGTPHAVEETITILRDVAKNLRSLIEE